MRRAAALALVVLAVAGCGGGDSDSDDPTAAVRTYLRSFAAGDPALACARLTAPARTRLVARVAVIAPARDCPAAVRRIRAAAGPVAMAALARTRVTGVRVDGKRATATLRSGPGTQVARLVRTGGRWLLTAAPGTQ